MKGKAEIPVYRLENFFRDHAKPTNSLPDHDNVETPHPSPFSVYKRSDRPCKDHVSQSRRDFYKISLVLAGEGIFVWGEQKYHILPGDLIFMHPLQVKEWHSLTEAQDGFYCIFPEVFFNEPADIKFLKGYPFFSLTHTPVLRLTEPQCRSVQQIFENLFKEFHSDHANKWAILKHYLYILMLEANGYTQIPSVTTPTDSAHQLGVRFLRLLESQFPVESANEQLTLRKPMHFAAKLNVHVNYLNHAVKEVTGSTVSEHIYKRIIQEARLLLLYTDWPVNHIAYCLGFAEVANFTNFFKKHTGFSPTYIRQVAI